MKKKRRKPPSEPVPTIESSKKIEKIPPNPFHEPMIMIKRQKYKNTFFPCDIHPPPPSVKKNSPHIYKWLIVSQDFSCCFVRSISCIGRAFKQSAKKRP